MYCVVFLLKPTASESRIAFFTLICFLTYSTTSGNCSVTSSKPLVNKIILLFWTIKVYKVLSRIQPDIVYCSNLYTTHIGYLIKRKNNTPFIYDSHDLFIDQTTRYKNKYLIIDEVQYINPSQEVKNITIRECDSYCSENDEKNKWIKFAKTNDLDITVEENLIYDLIEV